MRWVGVAAVLGGLLWSAKSLAIVITGVQPDYLFEVAPAALAFATLGLARAWRRERGGGLVTVGLGAVASSAATVAAVVYVLQGGDEGLFGPALMIAMLSIIVLLFRMGLPWWRTRQGVRWRTVPYPLAWSHVLMLPVGGVLASLNERLLEVPLLAVATGWVWMGVELLSSHGAAGSEAVAPVHAKIEDVS